MLILELKGVNVVLWVLNFGIDGEGVLACTVGIDGEGVLACTVGIDGEGVGGGEKVGAPSRPCFLPLSHSPALPCLCCLLCRLNFERLRCTLTPRWYYVYLQVI